MNTFSSRRLSLEFFSFWEKWGDDIQVTGFLTASHTDTPNTLSPVITLYRKSSSLLLKQESKQAITDWFPVLLSLF
jgi:hypothetical protein